MLAEFAILYENRITKKKDVGNNFKCAFYGRFGGGVLHRMPETDDSQLAKARLVYPAMEAVDSENKYRPPQDLKFDALGRRVTEAEHDATRFQGCVGKGEDFEWNLATLLFLAAAYSNRFNLLRKMKYDPKSLEKLWGRIICRAIPCECSPKPK